MPVNLIDLIAVSDICLTLPYDQESSHMSFRILPPSLIHPPSQSLLRV